jgi:hypothetical protein
VSTVHLVDVIFDDEGAVVPVKAVDELGEFLLGGSVVGQVIRPHLDSGSGTTATTDLQLKCADIASPPGLYNASNLDSSPTPCVVDVAESR